MTIEVVASRKPASKKIKRLAKEDCGGGSAERYVLTAHLLGHQVDGLGGRCGWRRFGPRSGFLT
jgi:hypothetical protein